MSILDQFRRLLSGQQKPAGAEPEDTPATLSGYPITVSGYLEMPTTENMPRGSEAENILADIIGQAIDAKSGHRFKLADSERYRQLKNDPDTLQLAVMEAAAFGIPAYGSRSFTGNSAEVSQARKAIISQILRRKLEVPVDLQAKLLNHWLNSRRFSEYSDISGLAILDAVERQAAENNLSDELRPILEGIYAKLTKTNTYRRNPTKWERGVIDRLTALLDPASVENRPALPSGKFTEAFVEWSNSLPEKQRSSWQTLAVHAATAADKSAPSKKWTSEGGKLLNAMGKRVFAEGMVHWLGSTKPDPTQMDHSLDVLKGLLWMAPQASSEEIASAVGRFAELCFRKVPGVGARSVKLGNAALYALSEMAEAKLAGAELFRLRSIIKYPSARKLLDKRIEELAATSGSDIAGLEDAALPDHEIGADGTLRVNFGEAYALLTLTSADTEISWFNDAGKAVKNPPGSVKADFKSELAKFKLIAKDIEKARATQARRLEASWLEGRSWSLAGWREHYCEHNLRRPLVEALLWQFELADDRLMVALPVAGELHDITGAALEVPDDARVTLWHPLNAAPEQVLAWRQRILDLELTQPIKQAHREIYVLTDAERQTDVYSNRFAAHILRQHQFRALCHARDWQYDFMGMWDSWNVPTRTLPMQGLTVEYSVETVDDGRVSEAYIPLHLTTDQVRFLDTASKEQLSLSAVDPVIFSELMRDIDLFVAVTSVANDPTWADGGPNGRFGTYWNQWAFGDLGQSAETRKELISAIAPKLSIAANLEIGEKSLIVTGKRHKYAIHFGSTNIQILPENRYLCIVPAHSPAEIGNIRLPFTGDSQLSTILSKAFMLSDDDKITDKTILNQL